MFSVIKYGQLPMSKNTHGRHLIQQMENRRYCVILLLYPNKKMYIDVLFWQKIVYFHIYINKKYIVWQRRDRKRIRRFDPAWGNY